MSANRKIADIAAIRPGYLAREAVKSRADGTHHLLQLRDFNPDRSAIDLASLIRFTPDAPASARPIAPDEIVFLSRGNRFFAFAPAELPPATLAAAYFFVLKPIKGVLPGYLAWVLNQPSTLRTLSVSATSGAHMPVVRRADLENLEVPIPSLSVQRTIIDLDHLMRQEQGLLRDLAQKKRNLINSLSMKAAGGHDRGGVQP